jgi:probable HAF family extracellular repeat protein
MKRFSILALVLSACLVPLAWAQQSAGPPHPGPQGLLRHHFMNAMPQTNGPTANLSFYGPASRAHGLKTWDLGHHPNGTWADLIGINNSGVAVGWGDVGGETRMVGVSLYGPDAGKWFDGGVSSDDVDGWSQEGGRISDTGLIVGGIKGENGYARAHLWAPHGVGIDLGTLEGDTGSVAITINHSGTLIGGVSFLETDTAGEAHPVAWTPELGWHQGKPTITWKIHKLPTNGMEQPGAVYPDGTLSWWGPWGVNDRGQLTGDGWNDDGSKEIAVVWNPIHGGHGWEVQQLPHQSSYGFVSDHYWTEAIAINNLGEISGEASIDAPSCCSAPVLWRMSSRTHTWEMTEFPTLSGQRFGINHAYAINEAGDMVGFSTPICCSWDTYTAIATHWQAKDPSFIKAIGFPGDFSQAFGVTNSAIVVGYYSSGGGPDQAFAAAIH